MARVRTNHFVLAAFLIAGVCVPARALQLGEGKAQIMARHGAPGAEDRAKNVAIYFWEGWSAELEFKNDSIHKLIFRRNTYLTENEVTSLLKSNGGANRWREATPTDDGTRQWVRDDGATATCLAVRPLMMTFRMGELKVASVPRYTTEVKPQNVAPPTPEPYVSPAPTKFPKLLGSAPEPTLEPAVTNEAPPLKTTRAPERALPKLAAEEIAPNPAVKQERPARDTAWQLPAASADPGAEDGESRPAAASTPNNTSKGSSMPGILALLAAVAGGGGLYWLKFKRSHGAMETVTKAPVAPSRSESIPSSLATTPALDALRSDQYDLLVGEIFRRSGYMVELSAATGQDNIDLTLRRDSETILVQCKHWKASRVTEKEVRDFHGAMMANGAPRGILVTAGCFSREAQEFSTGKSIDLMDRMALEECIGAVARPGEKFCEITPWIEEFTAHARIFDPECPVCQGSMAIRHHRANGAASWTCRNHPRCPGRREARLNLLAATAAVH